MHGGQVSSKNYIYAVWRDKSSVWHSVDISAAFSWTFSDTNLYIKDFAWSLSGRKVGEYAFIGSCKAVVSYCGYEDPTEDGVVNEW